MSKFLVMVHFVCAFCVLGVAICFGLPKQQIGAMVLLAIFGFLIALCGLAARDSGLTKATLIPWFAVFGFCFIGGIGSKLLGAAP